MKAVSHFITITKHRHGVIRNCFKSGIGFKGLFHDLSKYTPTEFIAGCRHYQGNRSPNEAEREEYGYSKAWLHHKGRNRHHFEYWTDYSHETRRLEPIKMPLKYVIEMFCDRVAASKIYMGKNYTDASSLEYFLKSKSTRFINAETSDFLEKLLLMLKEEGEEKTFLYIKEYVKHNKDY